MVVVCASLAIAITTTTTIDGAIRTQVAVLAVEQVGGEIFEESCYSNFGKGTLTDRNVGHSVIEGDIWSADDIRWR